MQSPGTSQKVTDPVRKAAEIGFDLCGVIPAADLAPPDHLADWLAQGFGRGDALSSRSPPRRSCRTAARGAQRHRLRRELQPPAYSIEAAAQAALSDTPRAWISRYAWGHADYHLVVGELLEQFVAALRARFGGDYAARAYVDTGPISERMAAKLAGLGWLGKNTCLIHRDLGSWLFLGVILTSLDPAALALGAAPSPAPDLCGHCTLCSRRLSHGARSPNLTCSTPAAASSYLTIELRDAIPEEFRAGMGWQIFGCDICQDVCPWNRNAPYASVAGLAFDRARLETPEVLGLLSLSEEDFGAAFRGSAVRRTKWRGLVRNACVAAGNALRQPGSASAPSVPRLRNKTRANPR